MKVNNTWMVLLQKSQPCVTELHMQHMFRMGGGEKDEEFSISWKEQQQQLQVQNFPEDKNVFFIVHISPSMVVI